jgi:hypothetical protein
MVNEPHYNAPFDELGNSKRPEIIRTGTWASSQTGISAFPYPIAGGNLGGTYTFDAVASTEYRFQLPDSVNGQPGSAGYYFIEFGAIPFTSNSDIAQVTIIPAFSIDTVRYAFPQSGLVTPPFFYPLHEAPIFLNQGDFTSVKLAREVALFAVLRADLLRIRKIPTGPTLNATALLNFGNVSIYESERNAADNYHKELTINSGGETALRIDSVVVDNPRYYTLVGLPETPFLLPAVNGLLKVTVEFKPDTIANNRNTNIRIYSNDSTKSLFVIPVTGNGVGTGVLVEENDIQGSYVYPNSPVVYQDTENLNKWQILSSGSSGGSYVGYIYHLQGDPAMQNKSYVEYFPSIPTIPGSGAELDTFNVYARVPVGSVNSSPAAKYIIFQGGGGEVKEVIVNQNNRVSDRVFLGAAVFLRSGTRDAHGSGAINGYVRLVNDTTLVNAYYADSLVNRARQDSSLIRADAIIFQETLTGVEYEVLPNIPTRFDLSQNFPNPFNPTTRIRFDIPHSVDVQLRIFDILGREVRSLVNERHNAGSFTVTWDGKNNMGRQVSSGVYIYHLKAGEFTSSKKMVMMK